MIFNNRYRFNELQKSILVILNKNSLTFIVIFCYKLTAPYLKQKMEFI